MVAWRILITATEGGCRLDVSAVNGDHWRNVTEQVTAGLGELAAESAAK